MIEVYFRSGKDTTVRILSTFCICESCFYLPAKVSKHDFKSPVDLHVCQIGKNIPGFENLSLFNSYLIIIIKTNINDLFLFVSDLVSISLGFELYAGNTQGSEYCT